MFSSVKGMFFMTPLFFIMQLNCIIALHFFVLVFFFFFWYSFIFIYWQCIEQHFKMLFVHRFWVVLFLCSEIAGAIALLSFILWMNMEYFFCLSFPLECLLFFEFCAIEIVNVSLIWEIVNCAFTWMLLFVFLGDVQNNFDWIFISIVLKLWNFVMS